MNYYNEIDPFAAAWLRELIKAEQIPSGIVDERSIEDVRPDELEWYTQCHFFAGIGGWSLALRLAGWPDDRPVWTGSCPCQPFSAAGKGAGFDDERHLWPAFHWLIQQRQPATVFGEQVASKATGPWFDLVQADMEATGYAFGLTAFPAAGIGAPHIRDRAYWLGNRISAGLEGHAWHGDHTVGRQEPGGPTTPTGCALRLADSELQQRQGSTTSRDKAHRRQQAATETSGFHGDSRPSPTNGQWGAADWLLCRDGKWRPVEPGTFPLADGISARVGRLRGYGNAIVPQQAAEFVISVGEAQA